MKRKFRKHFSMSGCTINTRTNTIRNYWVVNQHKRKAVPMPEKYLLEMICDWRAMARKFGDTDQEFFKNNYHKMVLHPETFERIQQLLFVRVTSTNSI